MRVVNLDKQLVACQLVRVFSFYYNLTVGHSADRVFPDHPVRSESARPCGTLGRRGLFAPRRLSAVPLERCANPNS